MKVLVNGGLNVSELDGWWVEAYSPEVGWALGDGREHDDVAQWDAVEAQALYALLEREVIPQFYERDGQGIPSKWVARIRESMARLTPAFFRESRRTRVHRKALFARGGRISRSRCRWREARRGAAGLARATGPIWQDLRFGPVRVEPRDGLLHF